MRTFLNDKDAFIVEEAARAIYDETLDEAMRDLAGATNVSASSEPFWRRVVQANYREGRQTNAINLREIGLNTALPKTSRTEAFSMLGEWEAVQGRDPINSLWRPLAKKNGIDAVMAIRLVLTRVLQSTPADVQVQALLAVG